LSQAIVVTGAVESGGRLAWICWVLTASALPALS